MKLEAKARLSAANLDVNKARKAIATLVKEINDQAEAAFDIGKVKGNNTSNFEDPMTGSVINSFVWTPKPGSRMSEDKSMDAALEIMKTLKERGFRPDRLNYRLWQKKFPSGSIADREVLIFVYATPVRRNSVLVQFSVHEDMFK